MWKYLTLELGIEEEKTIATLATKSNYETFKTKKSYHIVL